MNNELYQALVQHYYNLQAERRACREQINVLEARYKAVDEQMIQVNDILCKHGSHIYEHFEEEQQMTESEKEKYACNICHYNDGKPHAECVLCNKIESEDKE